MKLLKKTGWFIVSMLPAVLSLLLQFGCGFAVIFVLIFFSAFKAQGNGTAAYDDMMQIAYNSYLENAIYVVILYHIIGIMVFGLWYYLAYGKKKRPDYAEKPDGKKLAAIVFLGICIQVLISGALSLIDLLNPKLLQRYMELLETAGISEFTLAAFIATVILAPVGEELLCRGIIFRLAGKVSKRFWIANSIQALAFGIIHGNLVQGTYAFFIGLVLGYIYGKYQNIWICMLLHSVINLISNFIDYYFQLFPEGYEIPVLFANVIISLLLMIFCLKFLGKRKVQQNQELIDNQVNMN